MISDLPDEFKISSFKCSFVSYHKEQEYRHESLRLDSIYAARGLLLLSLINILFIFADLQVFTSTIEFAENALTRVMVLITGVVSFLILRKNNRRSFLDWAIFCYASITTVLVTWQVFNMAFHASLSPTLFDILITYIIGTMATFLLLGNPLVFQTSISTLLFISFLCVGLIAFTPSAEQFPFAFIFLVLTNVVGYTTSNRRHKLKRTVWANFKIQQRITKQLEIEIEARKKLAAELTLLATMDSLTQVYNRREFYIQAEKEVERANRYQAELAVIMLDLDHFKQINDAFSHAAGDHVLTCAVGAMRKALRGSDLIGRIGGEEFAIILLHTSEEENAVIAERIRSEVESTLMTFDDHEINVTASMGMSRRLEATENLEQLLARADRALYSAKNSGRNQVVLAEMI